MQHAAQVDVDHRVPAVNVKLSHQAGPGDPGVTHEDVKASEPADRRGDQLLEVRAPGDIYGQDLRAAARGVGSSGQCAEPVGAPGAKHHRRAACSEFQRRGLANAAARSGDGDDLAVDSARRGDSCSSRQPSGCRPHIRTTDQIV